MQADTCTQRSERAHFKKQTYTVMTQPRHADCGESTEICMPWEQGSNGVTSTEITRSLEEVRDLQLAHNTNRRSHAARAAGFTQVGPCGHRPSQRGTATISVAAPPAPAAPLKPQLIHMQTY